MGETFQFAEASVNCRVLKWKICAKAWQDHNNVIVIFADDIIIIECLLEVQAKEVCNCNLFKRKHWGRAPSCRRTLGPFGGLRFFEFLFKITHFWLFCFFGFSKFLLKTCSWNTAWCMVAPQTCILEHSLPVALPPLSHCV